MTLLQNECGMGEIAQSQSVLTILVPRMPAVWILQMQCLDLRVLPIGMA